MEKAAVNIAPQEYLNERSFSDGEDTISLLNEKSWHLLSDQKKLGVLQAVADVEKNTLACQMN